jgi:hypothetical protein
MPRTAPKTSRATRRPVPRPASSRRAGRGRGHGVRLPGSGVGWPEAETTARSVESLLAALLRTELAELEERQAKLGSDLGE